MNVTYYHKKIDPLADDVRDYIERKLDTLKELARIQSAHVEVSQKGQSIFHVAVDLKTDHGVFYADEVTDSVEGCIDAIEDKLKQQVREEKQKNLTLTRRGARSLKKKRVIDDDARF